jgi:hypothetical protein
MPGYTHSECPKIFNVGTWNVRTMGPRGKLENVKREMKRAEINILGMSEVRWKGVGEFTSDEYRIIYSGGETGHRGVAVILDRKFKDRVTKITQHSDRLILIRIKSEPVDVVLIQVYMPTSDAEDEEVESIYEQIEDLIKKEKATDQVIVLGDWNAVVGEGREGKVVGEFGLGKRNERGQELVNFCKRMKLAVTNTWFRHEKRRRYTWKKPGDTGRYQLDYILIKHRYRNSVKNSRAYPGADVDSDHNLVMAKIELKLKKIVKSIQKRKWCMNELEKQKGKFQRVVEREMATEADDRNCSRTIQGKWKKLKEAITIGAKEVYGYQKARTAKKPWITKEMLDKMDERRKWKNTNTSYGKKEYSRLNNELRRETDKARNQWWNDKCDELAEYDRRGRSDLLYQEVGKLTRTTKKAGTKNIAINDKSGELKTEMSEVKERWKEYVEELYDKAGKPAEEDFELEDENMIESDQKGPDLLRDEIFAAIKCMKSGKAAGVDDIPAEFLKMLEGEALKELVELCMEIYTTGIWPEDFTKSVMIPIPKKSNAVDCADYRTISLISHASKILLKILNNRIQSKADVMLSKTQFGFRKGCGTREAIGVMRTICERSLEHGNEVFICFVDFEKAFDRIDWVKMLEILKGIGVDWRDRRLIMNLYMNQTAVVKIQQEYSDEGEIGRGVRQGCSLSPLLFNIYAEAMMVEAMEGIEEGVKIGGKLIKDVRFADDQGMIAKNEAGLQKSMDSLNSTSLRYGMKINSKKTKVMKVSRIKGEVNITINGIKIEQVESFRYLGHTMTDDGRCEKEINSRIAQAKDAFGERKELLTKSLEKSTKVKIVKTLVWSTLLYGSETWTLKKEDIRKLEALEMWLWRRMEKISWTDKVSNVEVLGRVGVERELINMLRSRKKSWIGHVLRGDGLLKEVIEGRMEGSKPRGRPRMGMLDDLITRSYVDMKRKTEDREGWKSYMPWTCR